jgi:excisionase family DNA binding protein
MVDISSQEAANRLGISQRRVRRLVAAGDLRGHQFAGVWHVDARDVAHRKAVSPNRGRPWSERVAWGGLWLLSGLTVDWLGDTEKWRLRKRLSEMSPEALALAVRRRARVERCRILPAYLEAVTQARGVVSGGLSAATSAGADIVGMDLAELYCGGETRDALFTRFAITADSSSRPNLIVRTIENPDLAQLLLDARTAMPPAAVAVDLIDSIESRTTHAGADLAARLLAGFDHG